MRSSCTVRPQDYRGEPAERGRFRAVLRPVLRQRRSARRYARPYLLFRMLRQNGRRLSKRGRQREFAKLTEAEERQVEEAYADAIEASA
jgi:hypothetical protein